MDAVTSLFGEAYFKGKMSSMEKQMNEGISYSMGNEDATVEGEEVNILGKKKGLSAEKKLHYAHYAQEFGNHFNILLKGRRWTVLQENKEQGVIIENFAQKAFPVTAYRCTGVVRAGVTLKQFAQLCYDLNERKKWDKEMGELTKTIHPIDKHISLDIVAYNAVLGGLVSGRTYVDVRSYDVKENVARVFWGSVRWEDTKIDGGLVRGWNYPQGLKIEQVEDKEFKVSLTIHRDVKGWLPYAAAESAMPSSILYEFNALRMFMEKFMPAQGPALIAPPEEKVEEPEPAKGASKNSRAVKKDAKAAPEEKPEKKGIFSKKK